MEKELKNKIGYKQVIIIVIFLAVISYYVGSKPVVNQDGDLFIGDEPQGFLNHSKNITDSATCRFQKSFSTFYMKRFTNFEPNPSEKIYYNFGNDNESDTITFVDLNTNSPKVKTNLGQSKLTIIQDTPDSIILGKTDVPNSGIVTYNLFKEKRYINLFTFKPVCLLGPTGTLKMGYCN